MFVGNQVRNAVCDDARLAAARAGKDQERAFGVGDGFTLWGVKTGEKIHVNSIFAGRWRHYTVGMAWTKLASVAEVPSDSLIEVEHEGNLYAICNASGDFRALAGICPHQGGPLGQGTLLQGMVICPWHMWEFDSRTGACLVDERMPIATYPVKIEANFVMVDLPETDLPANA